MLFGFHLSADVGEWGLSEGVRKLFLIFEVSSQVALGGESERLLR